ncbi:hypothetical protein Trydic_g2308 [Trypoxylus dichotomus]
MKPKTPLSKLSDPQLEDPYPSDRQQRTNRKPQRCLYLRQPYLTENFSSFFLRHTTPIFDITPSHEVKIPLHHLISIDKQTNIQKETKPIYVENDCNPRNCFAILFRYPNESMHVRNAAAVLRSTYKIRPSLSSAKQSLADRGTRKSTLAILPPTTFRVDLWFYPRTWIKIENNIVLPLYNDSPASIGEYDAVEGRLNKDSVGLLMFIDGGSKKKTFKLFFFVAFSFVVVAKYAYVKYPQKRSGEKG